MSFRLMLIIAIFSLLMMMPRESCRAYDSRCNIRQKFRRVALFPLIFTPSLYFSLFTISRRFHAFRCHAVDYMIEERSSLVISLFRVLAECRADGMSAHEWAGRQIASNRL